MVSIAETVFDASEVNFARHVWDLHKTNRGPHAAVLATARLAVQVKVEVQGEYDNSSRSR